VLGTSTRMKDEMKKLPEPVEVDYEDNDER